jgi:hypothetical protein
VLTALLLLVLAASAARGDNTFIWAVQLSAVVQANPPQISLNWEADDPYDPTNFTVFRKAKDDTTWGQPLASLPGLAQCL